MRQGQSRKFRQHFAKFACEGDTIRAELPGGFTAIARLHRDNDAQSPDKMSDGFWPNLDPNSAGYIGPKSQRALQRETAKAKEVMRAWEADEWFYVGVCVTIHKEEVQLTGDYDAALWGIDCNYPFSGRYRPNNYLRDVANELLSEALDAAKAKVVALAA